MARGPAVKIILGVSARSELEMRAYRRKIARVDAVRAGIVLLAADGTNNCAIAATLGGVLTPACQASGHAPAVNAPLLRARTVNSSPLH